MTVIDRSRNSRAYDVAIVSDFRYSGGTSASIAEEIRAQARNGLATVLVHVPASHLKSARSFNPRIIDCLRRGDAELAYPGEQVDATVAIARQPRVFSTEPDPPLQIRAERAVMVINQGPQDLGDNAPYYDLAEVKLRVERYLGPDVTWAPIGPLVRQQVRRVDPAFEMSAEDWHNIIDTSDWWADRRVPVDDVPVIGRHSRPDPKKWPRAADDIVAAYPVDGDFRVRVLGGGERAVARIGHLPDTWDLIPFGSMRPQDFLRTIDFFVYFHDPDWVEAFGRTILEAMASGAPVILPGHFRALFQDAALYATPDQVRDLVQALYSDWDRYLEVSRRAREFVEARFGYGTHLSRIERLGVKTPAASASPQRRHVGVTGQRGEGGASVMMLSSNGAGLGHLTRLMAVARRLPAGSRTVIATQSLAVPIVQQAGYLTEYIPSRTYLRVPSNRWQRLLHDRLNHLIGLYSPRVVMVDGTVPYMGLCRAITDHPEITWIWLRRAMWKAGLGEEWLERGKVFDFVLEPGEFAAAADNGSTVAHRDSAYAVAPIVYLDREELLDRPAARAALELDDSPAALLQLGAGNINDIASPLGRIANELQRNGFQVVIAQSPITVRPIEPPPGVKTVTLYPLSRYLRAFDLAVSAAGYNSFHELIGFGVPTVFIPNPDTELDDQIARAQFAAGSGVALAADADSREDLEIAVGRIIQPTVRAELADRCAQLAFENGSHAAASWLASLHPDLAGIQVGEG